MKNQQFTYVIAPEGCNDYLTPGKKYSALCVEKIGLSYGFYFRDDEDKEHFASSKGLLHTVDNFWLIPEIGQWPEGWTRHQKARCLQKAGVEILTSGFMQIIGEEKPYEKGVATCASTDEYQGRTPQQLEGSYKIMNICFIALFILIVLAAILI